MSRLRIHCFSISLDGYGAGPRQDLENPFGTGGLALHEWMRGTRTFQQTIGEDGGATGIEDDLVTRGFEDIGARILGRNMFGSTIRLPKVPLVRVASEGAGSSQ